MNLSTSTAGNGKTPGAFGVSKARLAVKRKFLSDSAREANRLSSEKQLKRAYAKFYATNAGKEFAKTYGKSYHSYAPRSANGGNGDVEFHDPADLPQASIIDHPIDHIEPKTEAGWAEGGIDPEQMVLIRETFRQVFSWALDGEGLVEKGLRCNVCIFRMRPDLADGLNIDGFLARQFDRGFKPDAVRITGIYFGRIIEWLRRGDPISSRGERVYLLAYTLWPSLINASTLATLGKMNGKTRQAKDKLANCLRDTFSGIKALAMRNDITRSRCRFSQLQHYEH